jgi:hypothetical protein
MKIYLGWMFMKKELMVGGIFFLLVFLILCGCTEQTATKEKTEPSLTENSRPVIQECHAEYFDKNNSATIYFYAIATDFDGTVVLYSWNLTDGFTSTEQSFIHTFSHPGAYQARLTVMDDKGMTNTTSITVYIYETSYENVQRDEQRIVGRWKNTEGTIVEFTSDGRFVSPEYQIQDYYWLANHVLFIRSTTNNLTSQYDYSFQGDNSLLFSPYRYPPTPLDSWIRV